MNGKFEKEVEFHYTGEVDTAAVMSNIVFIEEQLC